MAAAALAPDAESGGLWTAAEDPRLLLSRVALYETRGDGWKASDAQIEDFLRAHPD